MPQEITVASPEEIASGKILPPEMVRDLRNVADLDPDAITELVEVLNRVGGVLTEERIEDQSRRFFDELSAESIVRTMQNVPPDAKHQILALVDRWRQISDDGRQLMPDEVFASLRANLSSLLDNVPGLSLMRKAQGLLRATGNEIEASTIICDLRPVFDDARERVEAFVALANLRIRYVRQNSERDDFEIALTEDELTSLVEQGQRALSKLTVLRTTVPELLR